MPFQQSLKNASEELGGKKMSGKKGNDHVVVVINLRFRLVGGVEV